MAPQQVRDLVPIGRATANHPAVASLLVRRFAALIAAAVMAVVVPAVATPTPPAAAATCTAGTGPYQAQVEVYLKLPVDGRNSYSDCVAIRAWQVKNDIVPAAGYAGSLTNMVV